MSRSVALCAFIACALGGCATPRNEVVFPGDYPGTYWELVGWGDHQVRGGWEPATRPGDEARDVSVVYVNQFRRRGWGTAAPWSWFSNNQCFTYEVAAWRELKPVNASDAVAVRDESNQMHAFYSRESLIQRFIEEPLKYLKEAKDPEAADIPDAEGPGVHVARQFVTRGGLTGH